MKNILTKIFFFCLTVTWSSYLYGHGTIIFSNIEHGEGYIDVKIYEGKIAIVAYHDEDSNGELKTGLFWRPKEGFAFSNNYQPKGPPSFEKAAIILVHGEPVVIELNY